MNENAKKWVAATPRTDAFMDGGCEYDRNLTPNAYEVADFARELERELAQKQIDYEAMRDLRKIDEQEIIRLKEMLDRHIDQYER